MTSPETTEATRGNTSIERLAAGEGDPFRAMTFEAYRRLLALEPVPRSPEQGDRRLVEPIRATGMGGNASFPPLVVDMFAGSGAIPWACVDREEPVSVVAAESGDVGWRILNARRACLEFDARR